jgi:hypothetical protein
MKGKGGQMTKRGITLKDKEKRERSSVFGGEAENEKVAKPHEP